MNLLLSLRSEILKTKRTAAFYVTLVSAAVVPFIFLMNLLMDGTEDYKKDPLNGIFKMGAEINGMVFFPMFVVLICTMLPQIEYKNNTWKQVLASPQAKSNVFLAKFLNVHLLILLFLAANILFMFLAIVTVHFIEPGLNLLSYPVNGNKILINTGNAYVTILAICALQFWMGIRFKNFIAPIAIGIVLWFTGTLLIFQFNSSFANYFPYSFQIFGIYPKVKPQLNQVAWTSAGYAVLFLFLGFLEFRRRRMSA